MSYEFCSTFHTPGYERWRFQGNDNEVTLRNPPDALGDGEPEAVVLMRRRLAVAQEERRAKEEERRMREEERIAQEREWQRERERSAFQAENPILSNATIAKFQDIKALLPNMSDGDDPLIFFISFEHILELNAIDHGLGMLSASAAKPASSKTVSYTHLTLPTNREV